jgi:hypothetical protein
VWYLKFHRQGVFIGVQGGVTDLIKLVTRQVLVGRPSHVAGQPPSPASTDFKLQIPCYHLLESVLMKQTHERLQSGAGRTATPFAHWSVGFAHCLLVLDAFQW